MLPEPGVRQQKAQKTEALKIWIYTRMRHIKRTEKRTNEVLDQLELKREILKIVRARHLRYLGRVKRHDAMLKTQLCEQGQRGENKRVIVT